MELTDEQYAVIKHPLGYHARVLAVAGSGKTTTLAHRVKYLITEQSVSPDAVQVLMFNKRAEISFKEKLKELRIETQVNTFHSFAYRIIKSVHHNRFATWLDDAEIHYRVVQAISHVGKMHKKVKDSNPQKVKDMIALWKGALIKPEQAREGDYPEIAMIYQVFEEERLRRRLLTFNDFAPFAAQLLEERPDLCAYWHNRLRYLLVDEYQDVNTAQQRMIELLIGPQTDAMVVGDDDQTIYEWRGAQPEYLLEKFPELFSPSQDYVLSRSFRFGPLIAQCAENVIRFNQVRYVKPIVAHHIGKEGNVRVIERDANQKIAERIKSLLERKVAPHRIQVLISLFAQSHHLQIIFLQEAIGFQLRGRTIFVKEKAVQSLLDYLRLALALNDPPDEENLRWVLNTINKPSRYIKRETVSHIVSKGQTVRDGLAELAAFGGFSDKQKDTLQTYLKLLIKLRSDRRKAGPILASLVKKINYFDHFTKYYGEGTESYNQINAAKLFLSYVGWLKLKRDALLEHIDNLDPSCGLPKDKLITISSIHAVKGLEFDYIFMPQCEDDYIPGKADLDDKPSSDEEKDYLFSSANSTLESERRLFYVGFTRARMSITIGVGRTSERSVPSRFLEEIQLQAVRTSIPPLQRFIGEPDKKNHADLKRVITTHARNKPLIQSILSSYLQEHDTQVAEQLWKVSKKKSERPFRYKHKYQGGKNRK